jgi:hypothetical protein
MCTVVLRLDPGDFRLLGVRDEFAGRPWLPPARHWPDLPLVGGLDSQAGGTWLAVHPARRRISCILNGRGDSAEPATRRSRGELPLRAALSGEVPDGIEFASYDPFHLVCGDGDGAWLLSWDGKRAVTADLRPGTHLLTNAGHVYSAAGNSRDFRCHSHQNHGSFAGRVHSGGTERSSPPDEKGAYFGPRFEAARSREEWLVLSDGDGLAQDDPRAIIVRRDLPDGREWGTSSLSLVELAAGQLRYGFRAVAGEWRAVGCAEGV